MRSLSVWASRHKWPARFLIVISFVLLNGIGLFLGDVLVSSNIFISSLWIYVISFIFIAAFVSYPSRLQKKAYKNFYRSRKISDLFLVSTTFLLIICFGNHYNLSKNQSPFSVTYANATELIKARNISSNTNFIEPTPKKKSSLLKKWKNKLRENIRTIRKEYKDAAPGEKTALIILSLIVALVLLYLVLAASCSLSCSGADGAALVVGVLGTGLIVFLAVRVIKRINRGKPKPKAPEPQSTSM